MAVTKRADAAEAIVGETAIVYAYTVTNGGQTPLAIEAVDDKLGTIALAAQPSGLVLQPGQAVAATHVYTPTISDLPGPLLNTVVVTGVVSSEQVTATASASVDLLLRGQDNWQCYGDRIQVSVNAQPVSAAASGPFDLVVISGPAPQGLFLRGVEKYVPYTGFRSMVELTNQLATAGCAEGAACNPVTRIVFFPDGSYRIKTLQEVQSVNDLFLPLINNACLGELFCP